MKDVDLTSYDYGISVEVQDVGERSTKSWKPGRARETSLGYSMQTGLCLARRVEMITCAVSNFADGWLELPQMKGNSIQRVYLREEEL